jgi:CHAT domain-containing protein
LLASLNKYSELTYRWQWQIGRIKTQMGDAKGAIENYQESIDTLSLVQGRLLKGSFVAFRERVLPVYSELIDLLLAQAQLSENHIERQTLLVSVQETIEAFNRSEILDYFNDDCVLPAVGTKLNAISNDTVVVYPVLLADRIVIIAKFPDGIHQVSSSVDRKEVLGLVSDFREGLEGVDESVEEIQESSEELYNYLVAPISEKLEAQNIKRLVFVPASVLRMIPMAALYDGESYLVEKYQIATTLGLTLTEPAQRKDITSSLLLGGISESVQGFAALPGVVSEVGAIKNRFGGDLVLNKEFRLDDIAKQLSIGGHSIVHLATHGVFESEASNSYLLAYDDKLSLDKLQDTLGSRRFLGDPLDLLVLSACETAAGNERAALGLAGVALKAGAKSTVASLWPISDEGTSRLMIDFYGYLEKGESKSGALRLAQINLIQDPVFEHPNFWSPFLLVGNWL